MRPCVTTCLRPRRPARGGYGHADDGLPPRRAVHAISGAGPRQDAADPDFGRERGGRAAPPPDRADRRDVARERAADRAAHHGRSAGAIPRLARRRIAFRGSGPGGSRRAAEPRRGRNASDHGGGGRTRPYCAPSAGRTSRARDPSGRDRSGGGRRLLPSGISDPHAVPVRRDAVGHGVRPGGNTSPAGGAGRNPYAAGSPRRP